MGHKTRNKLAARLKKKLESVGIDDRTFVDRKTNQLVNVQKRAVKAMLQEGTDAEVESFLNMSSEEIHSYLEASGVF